jgi:hypothetical protein
MKDKTYGTTKQWYNVANGSTPTRLMGQRDDGMKHSMGQDYGGCTRPCLQCWGIGTVVRTEMFLVKFYLIAASPMCRDIAQDH